MSWEKQHDMEKMAWASDHHFLMVPSEFQLPHLYNRGDINLESYWTMRLKEPLKFVKFLVHGKQSTSGDFFSILEAVVCCYGYLNLGG